VIGFEPVQVELLVAVTREAQRAAIPAGTRGRAKRLFVDSDLALFRTATGERAVVPLSHLRELDAGTVAGEGGA